MSRVLLEWASAQLAGEFCRERRERPQPVVSESNIKYHTDIDMYDAEASRNFKKKGFGKTKSYGVSKRRF